MSIIDIVTETKFKQSTIVNHLLEFVKENELNNPENLLEASTISETERNNVLKMFESLGTDRLEPIFSGLKQKINYNELHLLRVYYLAVKN